jgi:2-hydroxy-6-oxonona-2,4-dienedioate hydrolase
MESIWLDLMGAELRLSYVDVAGVRTRCLEAGSGKPLLLLHGGGGHIEAYARNIARLAETFHVYAVDLIGHGFTDRPEIGSYSFKQVVDYIGNLQDALGHETLSIAGLSISAMSAAVYAGQHPERVTRLLLNTGVPLRADQAGRERWSASIEQRRRVSAEGSWSREEVRNRLGRVFHDGPASVPDELVEVRYQIYNQPGFTRYNNALIEALLVEIIGDNDFTARTGPQALASISCPTLLLWTTVNPGQGIGVAEQARDLIPRSELVVFNKSGHWPQWEQADEYNRLCADFFDA